MKSLLAFFLMLMATAAFSGESSTTNKPIRSAREIVEHTIMKRFGGHLRQPNTEHGKIVFVNLQKLVDKEVLQKVVKHLSTRYRYISEISDTDVQPDNSTLVIRLEESDRKERVLLAPENFWVSVNVSALKEDVPARITLEDRFSKEVRRAFAMVCCGTCSTYAGGLTGVVRKLSDLDSMSGIRFPPDVDVRIANNMPSTGLRPYRICKYSEAVQEGWAPPPTNDYQKAIWDKIHAAPKNPMKIEFDPKKGR